MWKSELIILLPLLATTLATNCHVPALNLNGYYNEIINEPITDSYSGELFKINIQNLTEYEFYGDFGKDSKFLKATEKDGHLVIATNEHFERFEEYHESVSRNEVRLNAEIYLKCENEGANIIDFYQPVKDINNHAPTFNRNTYKYKFGMPVPANMILTKFLEIFAVDIDVTNTLVDFSFDYPTEDLEISYDKLDYSNNKVHTAKLITKKQFPSGTYQYTIKAKDIGTPAKTSTAKIVIEID